MNREKEANDNIFRLSKMLIAHYDKQASEYAMKHALDAHDRGDLNGEKIWLKVLDTIKELQQKKTYLAKL